MNKLVDIDILCTYYDAVRERYPELTPQTVEFNNVREYAHKLACDNPVEYPAGKGSVFHCDTSKCPDAYTGNCCMWCMAKNKDRAAMCVQPCNAVKALVEL